METTSTERVKQWRLRNPEAHREWNRAWYKDTAEAVNKHKCDLGCSHCGYNKYGGALEWHHPNADKDYVFRTRGYFGPKAVVERAKCILLCCNCHREEHGRMKEQDGQAN
jgi:hypothetical protein